MCENGYAWGELSRGKIIPDFIMNSNDEYIRLFTRAYMDAEAHFAHKKGVIEMSTASYKVALQVYILLKRFGVISRILIKSKCATNTVARTMKTYYEVHISGPALRVYRDEIGFNVDYKKTGLDDVCDNRKTNTNTEIIPVFRELAKLRRLTETAGKASDKYKSLRSCI
jgi:intein/homing endonuclease